MIWRFRIFSCQKPESVGLSKTVIESFLDSDNFKFVLQETQERDIELKISRIFKFVRDLDIGMHFLPSWIPHHALYEVQVY